MRFDEIRRSLTTIVPVAAAFFFAAVDCHAASPSFSCTRAANAVERMICNDEALAALDRKLAEVYGTATKTPSRYADLNTGQRNWTRARNDCWQASDFRTCIEDLYVGRITELQTKYRLVAARGPILYVCNAENVAELKATFFETDPLSVTLEQGDETTVAYLKRSGGVVRYEASNVRFREQSGDAVLAWGRGAKDVTCALKK